MKFKIKKTVVVSLVFSLLFSMLSVVTAGNVSANAKGPKEKIVYVHRKGNNVKPVNPGGGKPAKGERCYTFLGSGVLWKNLPVNYVIDPDNSGLSESAVSSAISASAEEWDKNTGKELFGSYSVDYNSSWDSQTPDNRNEFVFGNYSDPNVIAVTVTWGYFSVAPRYREITEFDVLFNTNYAWGDAAVSPSLMDLQNIATHEIGHGVGLGDLYTLGCAQETMYGYSGEGETKKRDLNFGDIIGLQKLYGI